VTESLNSHRRYEKDILLSGLVYCHRISNTEMDADSVRHLRIFEELCGIDALQNVILATTMWDEVDKATGIMEEEKMKTKYWNKMLERRSTTGRFLGTYESALQLLQPLIDAANFKRSSLLLQHEMVDMGKQLTETSAGRHLFTEVQDIASQRQDVIQRIQIEMRRPVGDRTSLLNMTNQKVGPIDLNIDRPESKVSSTAAVSPSSDLGTHKRGKRYILYRFLNVKSKTYHID
jgi:hypothetical protein